MIYESSFEQFFANRILKIFCLGCMVSGWKVYLTNTSNINEAAFLSNISVTDCREKCYEDENCQAFEAHCRPEHHVSHENYFIHKFLLSFFYYLRILTSNHICFVFKEHFKSNVGTTQNHSKELLL